MNEITVSAFVDELEKIAVSDEWIEKRVRSGVEGASIKKGVNFGNRLQFQAAKKAVENNKLPAHKYDHAAKINRQRAFAGRTATEMTEPLRKALGKTFGYGLKVVK